MFSSQNISDIIDIKFEDKNITKILGKCDNNCHPFFDNILHICKKCGKMLCSTCIKNDNTICAICSVKIKKVCKSCKTEYIKHFMCSYCGKLKYICSICAYHQGRNSTFCSKFPEIILSCLSNECTNKLIEYSKKIRGY